MSVQNRTVRVTDSALRDAASRLEWFTRMVNNRLDESNAANDRVGRGVALQEAEVAAQLVESAAFEVALRLIPHRVEFDPAQEVNRRLHRFRMAKLEYDVAYGPIALA